MILQNRSTFSHLGLTFSRYTTEIVWCPFLLFDKCRREQWSARMLSIDDTHCVLIFIRCRIINMCELCAHLSYGALGQRAESNQDLAEVLSMPKMVIFPFQ